MTNLWLRTDNNSSSKELWLIDYDKGIAERSSDNPEGESIRMWNGTVSEYLQQREIKIIHKSEGLIKFVP